MSISFQVLGEPGGDNALLLQIDSGQSLERLLFDCGEGCLATVPFADVQAIDHVFFSHFHMDHVSGFDSLFRCVYGREAKPNWIWGPPGSSRILHHRFQGFTWNLHEGMNATWRIGEIHADHVTVTRFELHEAFTVAHAEAPRAYDGVLCDGAGFRVEAMTMDHRTPSMAYIVREKPRQNIDTSRLASLGLRPGPWLKQVKDATDGGSTVVVDGATRTVDEMRRLLLVETPGDSVAYLTDFLLDDAAIDRLADALRGCRTLVCEGQYRHADWELAQRHYHMTTVRSAMLAARAQAAELVLLHLSDRYQRHEWIDMLGEAREVFAHTSYPSSWNLASEPTAATILA